MYFYPPFVLRSAEKGEAVEIPGNTLSQHEDFASDLLRGAEQIASFLFGDPAQRRKVYHLVETSRIPIFRLGSLVCARRSILLAWIASQEKRGW